MRRMAIWRDIARQNEDAAKQLNRNGLYRSAVSRAYYAAYAVVVGRLSSAGAVSDRNPSHRALPIMVEGNISGLRDWQRRNLKAITRRLYNSRLEADYRGDVEVGVDMARQSLMDMGNAFSLLREEPG